MNTTPELTVPLLFLVFLAIAWLCVYAFMAKSRRVFVIGSLIVVAIGFITILQTKRTDYSKFHLTLDGETMASGQIVGGGSRWQTSFEQSRIADVYSSEKAAVESLARQCAHFLNAQREAQGRTPTITITAFANTPQPLRALFAQMVHDEVPDIRVTDENGVGVLDFGPQRRESLEAQGEGITHLSAYYVSFLFEGAEKRIESRYTDKTWVQDPNAFGLAKDSVNQFFVAVGQPEYNPMNGELPARLFAKQHVTKLIRAALPNTTPYYRGYTKSTKLMEELSELVTRDLIADEFVQSFDRSLDGKKLHYSERRDAVLVDCTNERLQQALDNALQRVSRGSAYPTQRADGELMLGFGGVSTLIFFVAWVITRFFDGGFGWRRRASR